MTILRPNFMVAWTFFSEINVPVKDVGKKGIIVFWGSGWSNARGHVTL